MGEPKPIPAIDIEAPPQGGDFGAAITETDMVYFLLNVGNADAQLIMLPQHDGRRRLIVVDVGGFAVMDQLIKSLQAANFIPSEPEIAVVVATHPHWDHISGMSSLLKAYKVNEFWDPGYDTGRPAYIKMYAEAESRTHVCMPTSGYEKRFGLVHLRVLAPSIALKHQFGMQGIEENNSSIALMIEYPEKRVVQRPRERSELRRSRGSRLLLGADAQTASWAHVEKDFPALKTRASWLAREMLHHQGADYLDADIFKVPHHGSKYGINLELVERVHPRYSLVSCAKGGGVHRFPHDVAQEILREACQKTAGRGRERAADHKLGIHYTSDHVDSSSGGKPLGSIAVIVGLNSKRLQLWRLCDDVKAGYPVDLSQAVKVT